MLLNHLQIFGETVRSLRGDEFDIRSGRGWSRAKLAEATGLTTQIIARIERGERANLEFELLVKFADVFQLATEERARFFLIASVPIMAIARGNIDSKKVLQSILEKLINASRPAILHNALYQIVAVNRAYLRLYNIQFDFFDRPDLGVIQHHHLRLMYDFNSPLSGILGDRLDSGRFRTSAYWRYLSLPYRHTQRFGEIQTALEIAFPTFAEKWPFLSKNLRLHDNAGLVRSVHYQHPQLGMVDYSLNTKVYYTPLGEVFESVHVPSDKRTEVIFKELTLENEALCFANPWEPVEQYYNSHRS